LSSTYFAIQSYHISNGVQSKKKALGPQKLPKHHWFFFYYICLEYSPKHVFIFLELQSHSHIFGCYYLFEISILKLNCFSLQFFLIVPTSHHDHILRLVPILIIFKELSASQSHRYTITDSQIQQLQSMLFHLPKLIPMVQHREKTLRKFSRKTKHKQFL
jgi:hypothetical protein